LNFTLLQTSIIYLILSYLLALAKDSQADYLITGDGDLLTLKNFEETEILTYQDFITRINISYSMTLILPVTTSLIRVLRSSFSFSIWALMV
jgi:hypothetical protein